MRGITPVARLYEAVNAERVAVAAALGAAVPDVADWFELHSDHSIFCPLAFGFAGGATT